LFGLIYCSLFIVPYPFSFTFSYLKALIPCSLLFLFRDSHHSINASPDTVKKAGALIRISKIMPFMTAFHPKNSQRKCMKAISENTTTAMVVNGFLIPFLKGCLYHLFITH
jgi:hypothetical protein